MRRATRRRQRGQTIIMATIVMTAMLGAVAMVIDTGIFLVVQRQLQSAADAGALAGAWHDPVCPLGADLCLSTGSAFTEASAVALANAETIKQLCGGAIDAPTVSVGTPINHLIRPNVNWIVVTVQCSAGYSFGRILGLDRRVISASSAAAIGDRDPNGDMTDFTTTVPLACRPDLCRIARLVQ